MKSPLAHRLGTCFLTAILVFALRPAAKAEPITVRHMQGTVHGFLEMRSPDGQVLASGDSIQVVRGAQVTTHTLFTFKDGSVDDETTVFTQTKIFHLITDHHIQKGPAFPHPMDILIDTRTGQVTVRSTGKDGKDEVKTDHINLPPDLANGLVPFAVENLPSGAAVTRVSMLVLTPKPRLVKLAISPGGDEPFSVVGSPAKRPITKSRSNSAEPPASSRP
jgi:hypothetical protein